MHSLQGPNALVSAGFVLIWGSNYLNPVNPIETTTQGNSCLPTHHRVRYLLIVLRYPLQSIGELYQKSHQPPTMCSFVMPCYLQCRILIVRHSFCSPSGQVSGHCTQRTGSEIHLDLHEHMICNCFYPCNIHSSIDHTVPD